MLTGNALKTASNYAILKWFFWGQIAIRDVFPMSGKINVKWINTDEAGDCLGVKPASVRDRIRKGKGIPVQKTGKQWNIECSELDEWAKSGKSTID